MDCLIACPVYKRDWILPEWLDLISKQTVGLNNLGFLFLMAEEKDDPKSYKILFDWQSKNPEINFFDIITEPSPHHKIHPPGVRSWRHEDYRKMAFFRNRILQRVKQIRPPNFLSLDSDILLTNPQTIEVLLDRLKNYDAVSPLVYMSPIDEKYPNILSWKNPFKPGTETVRNRKKYPMGTTFQADVIMAAVLMSPEAYMTTKYYPHVAGEDVGWAYDMYKRKLTMGLVSELYCPHIMHEKLPEQFPDILKNAPGIYENYKKYGDPRGIC